MTLTCLTGTSSGGRLQVTLVKRAADIPTFQAAFDLLFPALDRAGDEGGADGPPARDGAARQAPDGEPVAPDLLARLVALLRGDPAASAGELAAEVIGAYGGLGTGQAAGSQRYYEYRIMRQLDLSTLLHRAMRLDARDAGAAASLGQAAWPPGAGGTNAGAARRDRRAAA